MMHYLACTAAALAMSLYLTESPLDPYLWERPFELPAWNEEWHLNRQLEGAERLLQGQLFGPESIALHPDKDVDYLFASVMGGAVVQVATNGSYVRNVFFVGGHMQACIGSGLDKTELLSHCEQQTKAGNMAWNETNEIACGRPLGLRIREIEGHWHLFVLDAYHGLFRLNMTRCDPFRSGEEDDSSCQVRHLFNAKINVQLPPELSKPKVREIRGNLSHPRLFESAPKFFNDFDISPLDGCVYFTDSSYKWSRSNNRIEILDGAPRGRLLRYCSKNILAPMPAHLPIKRKSDGQCMVDRGRIEVILCGLHFANGVQFSNGGLELLVAETTRFRVIRIDAASISAPGSTNDIDKRKQREFDHIRVNTCFGSAPNYSSFSSVDTYLGSEDVDWYQKAGLGIFVDALPGAPDNIRESPINGNILIGVGVKSVQPFSLLHFAYQSLWLRNMIGKVVPMRYIENLVPQYGLVLVVRKDGFPVDSYHDPTGAISMVSEAQFHPETGDLWIGSHSNSFIGVDRLMKDKDALFELMTEQAADIEKYFAENRKIYRRWKDQHDLEEALREQAGEI